MKKQVTIISVDNVINMIFLIRGQKVMIDKDLASLYGVETKQLKRAVRRNADRFPDDFMFMITIKELDSLRCQNDTSRWGGVRYSPMVFTEQGVAMLSTVLNSDQAIKINITIIRAFVQFRKLIESNNKLSQKIEELEKTVNSHDEHIRVIFEAIRQLIEQKEEPPVQRNPIGYRK
jgi:hypothetical protein